ncbi:spermidine synthase [Crassisporium funariophilum]|nr:spermidine synthase [Crassisporium funariophilum]
MSTPNYRSLGLTAACVISVVLPLSLVIFTHQRELTPLYGSGPTCFLLDKIVLAAIVASVTQPFKVSRSRNLLYAALALTLAPNATYWVAVWTSRRKDAVLGPAITHATVLGPVVFILTTFVAEMEDMTSLKSKTGSSSREAPIVLRLVRGGICYLISNALAQRLWSPTTLFYNVSDSQIYLTLAGVLYSLWLFIPSAGSTSTKTTSKKNKMKGTSAQGNGIYKSMMSMIFIGLWWAVHPYLANPILPHPLPETYTHPTYPLQILSAEQSITGLITVGEWLPPRDHNGENDNELHSARYLRASHSILGGVWTHDKVQVLDDEQPITDSFGTPLGDSIYATFVLQEAVRLVNSTKAGETGNWNNALVIGLGTGISATSFMRHGVSTTIVEIDPAVYKAARTFFGLPDPGQGKVFLEDARAWVSGKRASLETGNNEALFDFVVHDCFSGGGVPEHIFTLEFWNDLKATMQPDGVLVVNFAGILKSESTRLITNTLERSFGQCRAFHDMFDELSDEKLETEFINMVLFCSQSPEPITFRNTRKSDWLGSPLRRHVLKSLLTREVNLSAIRQDPENDRWVLTDQHNPLGALQEKQGNHHWQVMREVLPDIHWETY